MSFFCWRCRGSACRSGSPCSRARRPSDRFNSSPLLGGARFGYHRGEKSEKYVISLSLSFSLSYEYTHSHNSSTHTHSLSFTSTHAKALIHDKYSWTSHKTEKGIHVLKTTEWRFYSCSFGSARLLFVCGWGRNAECACVGVLRERERERERKSN